jgi:mono/diheme cytochrome c family protein
MRFILLAGLALLALPASSGAQSLARGKYLVEQVGMCDDCHTPRDATGAPIAAQSLQGAPIAFRPVHAMPFAVFAPRLAGLPGHFTPAEMAAFLQTGKRPDGSTPRPPMPGYRLSKADAWAVVDYLQSLKPAH